MRTGKSKSIYPTLQPDRTLTKFRTEILNQLKSLTLTLDSMNDEVDNHMIRDNQVVFRSLQDPDLPSNDLRKIRSQFSPLFM